MIDIQDKVDCCGCTACVAVCPQQCISMSADEEGFLYPKVDVDACIQCGLCNKVCPIQNKNHLTEHDVTGCLVQNKTTEELYGSTSGGFFSPLAKWVCNNNGVVYGAILDENMEVSHSRIDHCSQLYKFRGSKYVQSNLDGIFAKVKTDLNSGILVCFSGTPCQIAGLKSYLRKSYENLITVDLVCHGVPSPMLWKKYIQYNNKKYNDVVKNAVFRDKKFGYLRSSMKLEFQNRKPKYFFTMDDYFLSAFFAEICSRPSCHECAFKTKSRVSDFTIFDCWNTTNFTSNMNKNLGATHVIIQSERGEEILSKISKAFDSHVVNVDKAIKYDGSMVYKSTTPNAGRAEFFSDLQTLDVIALKKKYYASSLKVVVNSKVRQLIIKLGLFDIFFNR